MKKFGITCIWFLVGLCFTVALASTTFTTSENSYSGRVSNVKRLTIATVPEAVFISESSDSVAGILDRIVLVNEGDDDDFTVTLKDENGFTLFEKSDCNTTDSLLSYALTFAATDGNDWPGIPVCGPLTVEINDVNYTTELQTLSLTSTGSDPNGGTFELYYGDANTAAIAYDANGAEIIAALEAITAIGSGGITADDANDAATLLSSSTVTLIFTGFDGDDVSLLTADVTGLTSADPNDVITITAVETVKGKYDINDVNIVLYYRDQRY